MPAKPNNTYDHWYTDEYLDDEYLDDEYIVSGVLGRSRRPDVPIDVEYVEAANFWVRLRGAQRYIAVGLTRALREYVLQTRRSPP